MNYNTINEQATELVDSFAAMDAANKWAHFINMQNQLASTPIDQLLQTPAYIPVIFAGHVRFNDAAYIKNLRDSINWPAECLKPQLELMIVRRAASFAESKVNVWRMLKQEYPSHGAMAIFVTHSLAFKRSTKAFLTNLRQ